MDLHTAGHRRGVVAAPHHAAAEAGRAILAEGGNAVEAMVAMAATIVAVYPHMNHIGGDGFWLIREPFGRVRALMAAGPAGANARIALYREHGYDEIPPRGPLAALTVPGAIAGWMLALEAAHALGGKLPLDLLLAAAIRLARDGSPVTRSQARLSAEKFSELKDVPGFAAAFLPDGKTPEAGALLPQAALATTLDHLAHAGLDDFYRGDVGREIAADLARIGSPVTRPDLAAFQASVVEPLRVNLQQGTLYNTPPPTQGLASLDDPRAVRAPAGRGGRELRSRPWSDRIDQAGVRGARPGHHRSAAPAACRRPLSRPEIPERGGREDRPPQGRALAGPPWRGRHDLDGRGRRVRTCRLLHPVALLGVRLRLRAAGDRRADAEPRRELLARSALAQSR